MASIFSKIEKDVPLKRIKTLAKKCSRSFSITSYKSLEIAYELAYWLYLTGHSKNALEVCKLVNLYEFEGNYDFWTPVQYTLALESRIQKELKLKTKGKSPIKKVSDALKIGKDSLAIKTNKKVFERMLSGSDLDDHRDTIAELIEDGDLKTADEMKLALFSDLCLINEVGAKLPLKKKELEKELCQIHNDFLEST